MTNKKGIKRSLLMSALALLLCVSMLIGSTFAWFTDSVTSAGNIIKSGTLDISMNWADGKEDPATTTAWTDASKGPIFNYDKWEPGYTEARHIAVKNEGTLALKYQLTIVPTGEVSKLADVIDVYYIKTATQLDDRADLSAYTPVGTLAQLINNEISAVDVMPNGKLAAGEGFVATLVLKMQESAGNEYQNKSIGSAFSIQLLATQYTSESDSFDAQYDANAWTEVAETPEVDADGVVTVWTAEQLAGVMSNVKGVTTINIMENIDLSGRNWIPANFWDPENLAQLTINGNGHTISNMTAKGSKNVGFIGSNARKLTIKDLTFENADVTATGNFVGTVIGYMYGNVTLENVDVIDSAVVSTGTYGIRVGGLVGFAPNETGVALTMKDCDVTGSTISGYHNVGAMVGSTITQTVTVENCTAKNNTLYYGSQKVGAFAFGASTDGFTEYVPASGFTTENNKLELVAVASSTDALNQAIENGATTVILGDGNYIIPDSAAGKTLTIVGNGNTVIATQDDGSYEGCDYSLKGANVTFDGVVINSDGTTYTGYAYCKATYNNCTINGAFWLYDESEFNNCTFNVSGDNYNLWTWGGKNVKFNNCTFNCDGKSVLVYSSSCNVTFNGCTFNDRTNGTAFTKSAIETGADNNTTVYNIYINDTVVNGFAENDKCVGYKNVVGNKNSLDNAHLNIVVDGVDVY